MKKLFDGKNAYEFVQKINFIRVGGTKAEKEAAEIIAKQIREIGLQPEYHDFSLATCHRFSSKMKILSPYEKEIKMTHRVISGGTPPDGLTADFKYIDSGGERFCEDIEGKVVMTTGTVDRILYERLTRHHATAVIIPMEHNKELLGITFNGDYVKKWGELPVCYISYNDALEMVKQNVSKVFLCIEDASDLEGVGRNIVAEIKGTYRPDEEFIFCGHFDSTLNHGIYDNAAGTSTVLELARHFQNNPPKRTVRFILFSGEELGLRGSMAYVKALKSSEEALKRIKMVFNFDLGGTILGKNCVRVTAGKSVYHYLDALNIIEDLDMTIEYDIYSSDNMPFCGEGIPAVNFYRQALGLGHSWNDTIENISPDAFEIIGNFALRFTLGIVNAPVLPFKRTIGKEMAKKVKVYLSRFGTEEPEPAEDDE
ncbi:MAG: M28 family metallopeptidase [Candidatus Neomarinimicrobiota bacterium]